MDWIAGTSILLATPIIPFAIRKWIVKRPLGKVVAGTISFGIWLGLFSFFWWAASLVDLQDWYSRKPHLGILAVAAVSYWMLTRPGRDVARRANDESSDDKTGLRIETRETPQQDSGRATEATRRSHAIQSSASANPNRVNWRRGLLRLWIFVSILWLAGAGSIAVLESSPMQEHRIPRTEDEQAACEAKLSQNSTPPTDAPKPSVSQFLDNYTPLDFSCDGTLVEYVRDWNLPERDVVSVIIGVPLSALGLGLALAWIISGFRDSHKDTT